MTVLGSLDREAIRQVVLRVCGELNETLSRPVLVSQGDAAVLFGPEGVLDSLALVSLLSTVEMTLQDEYGVDVLLADERAMSATRSPFQTVGSLVEHILKIQPEQT